MPNRPIPTRLVYPVVFAALVVAALVFLGAPDLILIPIAVITVIVVGAVIARHYLRKER
ncbi:hypothetical protein [Streptomonospora wellingtoniae]|uniref:Secreted protein n=1 Tax=Streptomonospora wellingtoniae TaxID=3075544 RepID=A0ABU2KU94_9ACTN|nr:hypothetical protein [Streptomonospora sp. DSM 45055]MDT0302866.1 hypothetical protein [Streptomonospora sp. DSM 45055]